MTTTTEARAKRQALDSGTYSVPDLAALLKCSEKHVRRKTGEIPGVIRFGRLVRFSKRLIDEWLTKGTP